MSGGVRQNICFLFGGEERTLAGIDPTLTLLDWLRLDERKTGTKEGCAEGDCGACTVLVGRLVQGKLRYECVNACIRFMATLDGCHLLTVDHLKAADGALHPVQQAMVECHGSQCGFCTPGFVMSLYALWLNEKAPDRRRVVEALQGNLCRCTGYLPIIAAAQRMYELGGRKHDPLVRGRAKIVARVKALQDGREIRINGDERRFIAPATSDQLAKTLKVHSGATILAGGTDVGLWVTKDMRRLDPVIYVGRIEDLQAVEWRDDHLWIGAGATYTDAWPLLAKSFPALDELIGRIGGAQVRNMGTIGGNIANGSPIGDTPPPFIALGAELVLRRGGRRRVIALEDFFLAYGKQDRAGDEFVEGVRIARLPKRSRFAVYKISKRRDEDISALCGAFRLDFANSGKVENARIAFGGMAATPRRALAAERALTGALFNEASIEQAAAALAHDYRPIGDMRASARYRLKVAQNLLRRFFLETAHPDMNVRLGKQEAMAHG